MQATGSLLLGEVAYDRQERRLLHKDDHRLVGVQHDDVQPCGQRYRIGLIRLHKCDAPQVVWGECGEGIAAHVQVHVQQCKQLQWKAVPYMAPGVPCGIDFVNDKKYCCRLGEFGFITARASS